MLYSVGRVQALTFTGSNVVQVQLVALLGSLQSALGGKEVAGGIKGLVVSAADLKTKINSSKNAAVCKIDANFIRDKCIFTQMFLTPFKLRSLEKKIHLRFGYIYAVQNYMVTHSFYKKVFKKYITEAFLFILLFFF